MTRRFVDLSITLENDVISDPPFLRPKISYQTHDDTVGELAHFFDGVGRDDLPGGEGFAAAEWVTLTTHNGTHLDAPYHYHPTMNRGERAITIDEVPLDWCFRPGLKLDFTALPDGHVVTAAEVEAELARIGHELQPLDIVLVNTRAGRALGGPDYVDAGCGMGYEATMYLTTRGVRVTGTDAWSWDAPFSHTARRLRKRATPASFGKAIAPGSRSAIVTSRSFIILKRFPAMASPSVAFLTRSRAPRPAGRAPSRSSMTRLPSFSLADKTALVTGATRGIGRGIAEAFAAAGAKIIVSSEDKRATSTTVSELWQQYPHVSGVTADLADPAAPQNLWGMIEKRGKLDILVCNAGMTGLPGPLQTMDLADYDRVMTINLRSMVALCQCALPAIAAGGGGSVLLSSIAGIRGNGAINAYALAKAGVAQLARNLAVEWGPRGVRVNAISPGLIRTELSGPLLANKIFMTRRLAMTPLRRVGEINEVAGAALFLASAAGGFVNGHNLVVDGGTLITDGS